MGRKSLFTPLLPIMIPTRRLLPLAVVLGVLTLGESLQAQVRSSLRMSKKQYVAHEQVLATVTITNDTGRDLLIHSDGQFNWLDFVVKNARGTSLTPLAQRKFEAVNIPPGRSIAKTIDLTGLYRVTDPGNFRCHAVVRLPRGRGNFPTNSALFNVTRGKQIYSHRVGDPANRNVREFRLSIHTTSKKSSVYVHVIDIQTGRTIQAFRMGDTLTFRKPKATVDRARNLHVLFLTAPNIYAHAQVSANGKYLGTEYFTPAPGAKPALATFANGDVVIAGGIPYDPKANQERRASIRKLSERPRLTYR